MANKRIDELPLTATFASTDLFEKERDPSSSRVHEHCTLQQLADYLLGRLNYNVFENTAALRLNSIYVDARVYATLGDLAKGDGYAKMYYFDEDSVLVDNGGSIIKPSAISAVNPGRYLQFNV